MKKRLYRKGYFFLLDSVLALGILAVGAFLIFTSYADIPIQGQPAILSSDIMSFFTDNEIKDINNAYAGLGGTLWEEEGSPTGLCPGEELIAVADNTLLQQVGVFYEKSSGNPCYLDLAEKFIIQLTLNILPKQYIFEFWIDGIQLYPKVPTEQHLSSKSSAEILIPSKKLVHGIIDQENGDLFGPYDTEVLVWQQNN